MLPIRFHLAHAPLPVEVARDVNDLQSLIQQLRQAVAESDIDVASAAAAPKRQDGLARWVQPKSHERLFARRLQAIFLQWITRGHRPVGRKVFGGFANRSRDPRRETLQSPDCQSRFDIWQIDYDRYSKQTRPKRQWQVRPTARQERDMWAQIA